VNEKYSQFRLALDEMTNRGLLQQNGGIQKFPNDFRKEFGLILHTLY